MKKTLQDVFNLWEASAKNDKAKSWQDQEPEKKNEHLPPKDVKGKKDLPSAKPTRTNDGPPVNWNTSEWDTLEDKTQYVPGSDKDKDVMQLDQEQDKLHKLEEAQKSAHLTPMQKAARLASLALGAIKAGAPFAAAEDLGKSLVFIKSSGEPGMERVEQEIKQAIKALHGVDPRSADRSLERIASFLKSKVAMQESLDALQEELAALGAVEEGMITPDMGTSVLGRSLFTGAALQPPNGYGPNFDPSGPASEELPPGYQKNTVPDPIAPEEGSGFQHQDVAGTILAPKQWLPRESVAKRLAEAIHQQRMAKLRR